MFGISDATHAQLQAVNRRARERSWPWRERARLEEVTRRLQEVAESGEWPAIPRILSLVFNPSQEIAEAAAHTLAELRRRVGTKDLGALDASFRSLFPYMTPEYAEWHALTPSGLMRVLSTLGLRVDGAARTLLLCALCHPNGRVRESAVRRAGIDPVAGDLPFLLLRSNDWVAPVRDAAHFVLRGRLREEHLADLISALPIIEHMPSWGRIRDSGLVFEIDGLLAGPAAVPHLHHGLSSLDRPTRRSCFRRLADSDHSDRVAVFDLALRDHDSWGRIWMGHRLLRAEPDLFFQFSDRLLQARSGSIRFGAAHRIVHLGRSWHWEQFLDDPHAGVRSLAQEAAIDADRDPAEAYRQRIPKCQGTRLATALLGLSETGMATDLEQIRLFAADRVPRVRKSVLRCLVNLKAEDLVDKCLEALKDESPGVNHLARDLLISRIGRVDPRSVWEVLESAATTSGKKDALAVLSRVDFWTGLPFLLQATMNPDPEVQECATGRVSSWLSRRNRVFTTPSSSAVSEIEKTLRLAALPEGWQKQVVDILRLARR